MKRSPRIPNNYTRLVKRQMLSRIIGENFDPPRTLGICIRERASEAEGGKKDGRERMREIPKISKPPLRSPILR